MEASDRDGASEIKSTDLGQIFFRLHSGDLGGWAATKQIIDERGEMTHGNT
jgi:hypothetical protein